MRELRVVGVSADGTHVICQDVESGERYGVPSDERLRAAARGDISRLGQIEIEMQSALRPREIQARIRAGATVAEVATIAGVGVEKIERFAHPVLLERTRAAELAALAHPLRHDGPSPSALGDVVGEALFAYGQNPSDADWDAWKGEDGFWVVQIAWQVGHTTHHAHWRFHPGSHGGTATPLDELADELTHPELIQPRRRLTPVATPTAGGDRDAVTFDANALIGAQRGRHEDEPYELDFRGSSEPDVGRAEAERVEAERVEAERREAERREAERVEAERVEAERVEAERVEAERLADERRQAEAAAEAERLEAERAAAQAAAEAQARAALAAEAAAHEAESARAEAARAETERAESERLEAEAAAAERREAERAAARRADAERAEAQRAEAERAELEQLAAEIAELERQEREQEAADRAEADRAEAERAEAERHETAPVAAEHSPTLDAPNADPAPQAPVYRLDDHRPARQTDAARQTDRDTEVGEPSGRGEPNDTNKVGSTDGKSTEVTSTSSEADAVPDSDDTDSDATDSPATDSDATDSPAADGTAGEGSDGTAGDTTDPHEQAPTKPRRRKSRKPQVPAWEDVLLGVRSNPHS